jgi:cobalt-zinc-cadmium efflux system outer membrane protein
MLTLSGCLYNARERADEAVCSLALDPYDRQPAPPAESKPKSSDSSAPSEKKTQGPDSPPLDLQTTALTISGSDVSPANSDDSQPLDKKKARLEPPIPSEVPGSETPRLPGKASPEDLQKIYDKLPPLMADPVPLPGPDGKPYTLSTLQQIATIKSPTLKQAAHDVETARGNLIQARAYKNPTIGWNVQPSNDGSTAGVQGPFIDQTISTAGKLKIAGAAAEMDLRNAELAFRRARSDLATQVRNAYFALLVSKEAVKVNKALAGFTDQMFRLQATGLLPGAVSAPYEPSALRAQAYSVRLAYNQSVQAYISAWEQLVAAIGLRHLPLTEVAGRIDTFIPYYEYDAVLSHVLRTHTDVLIARNTIEKARYNLKLAQVTPVPDVDFNVSFLQEYSLAPKQFVHTASIGFPFPIWDRNRGGIIAAEGVLGRAIEEPHRVEENLTTTLATAYSGYKQNLDALEYYRKFILPDQVRYYRGVVDRRQVDLTGVGFGDLVTAQQTLVTNVSSYLTTLGSLWTSVVAVADLLQTDDLFQMAQPRPVPPLPDLDSLPPLPCCHDCPLPVAGNSGAACPADSSKVVNLATTHPVAAGVASPSADSKGINLGHWHNPTGLKAQQPEALTTQKADVPLGIIQTVEASIPAPTPTTKTTNTEKSVSSEKGEIAEVKERVRLPRRLPLEDRHRGDSTVAPLEEPPPVPKPMNGNSEGL